MFTLDEKKIVHFRGSLKDPNKAVDFIKVKLKKEHDELVLNFFSDYEEGMIAYIQRNSFFEFSMALNAGTYDIEVFAADKSYHEQYNEDDFNIRISFSEIKNSAA